MGTTAGTERLACVLAAALMSRATLAAASDAAFAQIEAVGTKAAFVGILVEAT